MKIVINFFRAVFIYTAIVIFVITHRDQEETEGYKYDLGI
jgi:hypothetical protein